MQPLGRRLSWAFAVLGFLASLTSLYVHYQLLVNPAYASFCDLSETINCQQAYLSRYGTVLGAPTALYGVIWFGFVLILIGAGRIPAFRDSYPAYLLPTAAVGLAAVLYFAYAAFFILRAVCLMCLTTYTAVIGLFVVTALSRPRVPLGELPFRILHDLRALRTHRALAGSFAGFLVLAVAALVLFPAEAVLRVHAAERQAAQTPSAETRTEFQRFWESQPRLAVPVAVDDASVIIVKFADLQCPPCAKIYFDLRPILAKYDSLYPGAVKLVIKDWPWQPECNSAAPRPMHLAACDAAVAVRLAKQQGRSDQLEEYFYSNQATMSPVSVREAAASVGHVPDLDREYSRVIEGVKLDVGLGRLLGVRATPTFFVNGVKVESPTAQALDLAIAYELKRAGKWVEGR